MRTDMLHDNLFGLVEKYTGAAKDKNSERIAEAAAELKESAKNIRAEFRKNEESGVLGTKSKAFIAKIKPLIDQYAQSAEAIANLTGTDFAELEKGRLDFNEKFKVLEKEMGDFNAHLQGDIEKTKSLANSTITQSFALLGGVVVVMAIVLISVAVVTYRGISHGLGVLENTIAKVNKGDMTVRTRLKTSDELGHVGRSFDALLSERIAELESKNRENEVLNNSAIGLLEAVYALSEKNLTVRAPVTEDIVGTIASSVNQLADETGRTLGGVQQVANKVRMLAEMVQQQGRVVESAANRERTLLGAMGQTLESTAQHLVEVGSISSESAKVAARTANATNAARQAVDGTLLGMESLREGIAETEKRFKRLGERSQEISAAIALVNTISERTHVLSLNASMQAATAGEAGRGFVVVAQEVQRLSDSSRQATAEIARLVGNIQAEANETLITMNSLIADVVSQTDLARKAGAEMTQTEQATAELVQMVRQIAALSVKQQEMAHTLQANVRNLNEGVDQTVSAIVNQSQATQTLAQHSQELTHSVAQFNVGVLPQPT
jgi:methyl-accepting chemotaxis protein